MFVKIRLNSQSNYNKPNTTENSDFNNFYRVGRARGIGYSSGFYRLEFIFDCDVSCYVQIHFCAREYIDEHQQIRFLLFYDF